MVLKVKADTYSQLKAKRNTLLKFKILVYWDEQTGQQKNSKTTQKNQLATNLLYNKFGNKKLKTTHLLLKT